MTTSTHAPTMNASPAPRRAGTARALNAACLAFACLAVYGCATGPNANPRDPLEPLNRGVTRFNDGLDTTVLQPVALTYEKITPSVVRTGVNNFFGNLGDAWSALNHVLQAKPQAAAESFMRFSFNTVFGFGGLLDIASELRIERHKTDFGRTLGRWGVPSGPYLVLPVLGPSSARDAVALPADTLGGLGQVAHVPTRNSLYALRTVSQRASMLRVTTMLEDVAPDKYSFTRDTYLQLRANEVGDGKLPEADNAGDDPDGALPPPPPADEDGGAPGR